MFWHSLRHPQGELFSKPSAYCKGVTMVELQSMKLSYVGFFTQLFTVCTLQYYSTQSI
jgi:hypothetical protein